MDLSTILSFVAGIATGFISFQISERKIAIENITQQRKLWRDNVRKKALEIVRASKTNNKQKIFELYIEFQLILNPNDNEDYEILNTIWKMYKENHENNLPVELSEKLSLLLKHDWERAKRESKTILSRGKKPIRVKYATFMKKRNKS